MRHDEFIDKGGKRWKGYQPKPYVGEEAEWFKILNGELDGGIKPTTQDLSPADYLKLFLSVVAISSVVLLLVQYLLGGYICG